MISVERLSEGVRLEGVNYGLPMVMLKLGPVGQDYNTPEQLIRDVLDKTRCKWVCIFGQETTRIGMGNLAKGFAAIGMQTEIECDASIVNPGWMHTVSRWMVDYAENPSWNLGALREHDMVRFTIQSVAEVKIAQEGFNNLKMFPGNRIVKLVGDKATLRDLQPLVFDLVRKTERARLYIQQV